MDTCKLYIFSNSASYRKIVLYSLNYICSNPRNGLMNHTIKYIVWPFPVCVYRRCCSAQVNKTFESKHSNKTDITVILYE